MKAAFVMTSLALLAPLSAAQAQNPQAQPPCSAPEHRQLDFWVGDWDIEFTKQDGSLGTASNRVTKGEFGACVIVERFSLPGGGPGGSDFIGTSMSIFDAQTRTWRQMWVDNAGGVFDLRGGAVQGQSHRFEMVNIEPRGAANRMMRMIWEDVTQNSITWRWQYQSGTEWRDQWVLRYKRRGAAPS